MNNNIYKYSYVLSKMIINGADNDKTSIISGFSRFLISNGLALKIDNILSLTKKIIKKELMKRKVIIRKSKPDLLNDDSLSKIKNMFGNDFFVEEVVDTNLIGGLKLETFNKVIDSSIRGRLDNFSKSLEK